MRDQASKLRQMIEQHPNQPFVHTITVTSGKGGVGKTSLATNLALACIQQGRQVALLDGDLGLANIDVLLQLSPEYNVKHVIEGTKTLQEILLKGPEGLSIIPASSGVEALADLDETDRARLIYQFEQLKSLADLLLIDTGAGITPTVLNFAVASDQVVVVTTPDPTAMTDAYAMIKIITQRKPSARIRLVVNMARNAKHASEVARGLAEVVSRFLRVEIRCIGFVPTDPQVGDALRAQRPFVLNAPQSPASKSVRHLANKLLSMIQEDTTSPGFLRSILGEPWP